MERASKLAQSCARALAQRAAAVQARVLERAENAVVAADDEHRQVPDAYFVVVARVRDVVERARELPDARPQPLVFERGERGRRVTLGGNPDGHESSVHRTGGGRDRGDRRAVGAAGYWA